MTKTEKNLNYSDIILNGLKANDPDMFAELSAFSKCIQLNEITNSRYSIVLLLDLFFMGFKNGYEIEPILDEIKFLEGIKKESSTKKATQFKRLPLKGLWHKHYAEASLQSLYKNIQLAYRSYGIPYFEDRIKECEKKQKVEKVSQDDISKITNDITIVNIKRRITDQKFTGEWIIYSIHKNENYYLCIGSHHSEDDNTIHNRIKSISYKEYPFLDTT